MQYGDMVELLIDVPGYADKGDRVHYVAKARLGDDRFWGVKNNKKQFWVRPHEVKPVAEAETEAADPVNAPAHYVYEGFEVIDVLNEAFPDDPHLWAAGKYLLRAKRKGNEAQDLRKAIKMIEYRLKVLGNAN